MTTTHSAQDRQQLAGTRWRRDPSGSSAGFRVPGLWGLAFFDVERHPKVTFRSTRVIDHGGGRLHVEGALEAAGGRVRLPVEVTVEHTGGRLGVDAAATVDQRELGMTWSPLGVIRTPTALSVHARLRPER